VQPCQQTRLLLLVTPCDGCLQAGCACWLAVGVGSVGPTAMCWMPWGLFATGVPPLSVWCNRVMHVGRSAQHSAARRVCRAPPCWCHQVPSMCAPGHSISTAPART